MSEREMTLKEWVDRLPDGHTAKLQFIGFCVNFDQLREENKRLSEIEIKLASLLSRLTNNKYSKTNYSVDDMEAMIREEMESNND